MISQLNFDVIIYSVDTDKLWLTHVITFGAKRKPRVVVCSIFLPAKRSHTLKQMSSREDVYSQAVSVLN